MKFRIRALWAVTLFATAATALIAMVLTLLPAGRGFENPLSREEEHWLRGLDRPIVIAATPANRPIEYFDEHGDYRGMVADYFKLLEDRLGVSIEVVEPDNMKQLLEMAKSRRIDVIAAFAGNPAGIDYMQFTRPYLVLPTAILVNKSQRQFLTLDKIREKRMDLALPKEYGVIEHVRKNYPEIHIQPVYNYLAALLHVSFDEIDATIISLPQASYFIDEKGITNLRVAGHTEYKIYNRIGVRSDWPQLTNILQKGLDAVKTVEHQAIYRKWVRLDQNYVSFLRQARQFWSYAIGAALALVLTFAAIILWNRTLRRRVAVATAELKQELQSSRRMLAAIEQTRDGIFILDPYGILEYANPAFLKMLGCDEWELLGTPIATLRYGNYDANFYRAIWDNIHQGEVWLGQASYRRKDGSELAGDLTITPVMNEQGELVNIVEVVRDVTEKRKMEARARQSRKMEELGTLAGGIAHDFNNIVAAIMGYAELALPTTENGSRAELNLLRIKKVADRAKEMVNQILVFSRRKELERRRVELRSVVDEVTNLLRSSCPSTIEILKEAEVGGAVMGDPSQLHQIIMNLGTNAAYAMRETGGALSVRLSRRDLEADTLPATSTLEPGAHLQLEIGDTGVGIPPEVLERIFDPFFTTKPQGEGTGMGLAMVHGIVGAMRGEITVDSRPGEGTIFTILLPMVASAGAEECKGRGGAVHGRGRILLVDDDEDLVAINSEMLERLGYDVTGITESRKALALFHSDPNAFDLLITDQTMPALTGDKLAEAVHAARPQTPIILCTGNSDRVMHLAPGQFGIRKILFKPFELDDFSRSVKEALERKVSRS